MLGIVPRSSEDQLVFLTAESCSQPLVTLFFDLPLTYCIKRYYRKHTQLFGTVIWLNDLKSDTLDTSPPAQPFSYGTGAVTVPLRRNSIFKKKKKNCGEKDGWRIIPQKTCGAVSHDLSVVREIRSVGKHIRHTSQQ